ncbi:MAG: hypothetical protein Q7U06_02395 [Pseudomonadota bacterium]|nr:hypothetical protein [Pseudomonadota bacterium]
MILLALASAALAAPPGWTIAPFGIGVYVHGKPVRGVVYSATQAAGIATLAVASAKAYDAAVAEDEATFNQWQVLSVAGVTLAAGSYLASVFDGSRLHELEKEGETARARVQAWDVASRESAFWDAASREPSRWEASPREAASITAAKGP